MATSSSSYSTTTSTPEQRQEESSQSAPCSSYTEYLLSLNVLPDAVLRYGIRRQLAARIRESDRGGIETNQRALMSFVQELKSKPHIAEHTLKSKEQHYEIPAEFFEAVLGSRLKYSCGYWRESDRNVASLDDSEVAMLKLTCERAQLADGHSVLDLGCGWGSLSLYICEFYPQCHVTAVSNSASQRAFIEAKAKDQGFTNLTVITCDINNLELEANQFDRVVSVEMFEHMKNYELLFRRIASWLKPDSGLMFCHVFCHRSFAYHFESGANNWMANHFFTGGTMPSRDLFLYFQRDLNLVDHWAVNGSHYSRTLEAWLRRMDSNQYRTFSVIERIYGKPQATKWFAYWRVFFIACSESFRYNNGEEWFVCHYLFAPKTAQQTNQ